MKTTRRFTAAATVLLAGVAFAQPSGGGLGGPSGSGRPTSPGSTGTTPGAAGASGGGLRLENVKPYTNVEKSQLRERCLALLQDMARSDNALLRANAIEGMQPAPSRCEPLVRAGLADENLGVRFTAAMTVGRLKLKASAPLVKPLLRDPDPSVRAAAVFALVRTGHSVDQTELSALLMNGDARSRANAAFILGELGNPSAIPMLRDAARQPAPSDAPASVRLFRLQLAEAMVKLGDKPAGDTLEAALYPSSREDFEAAVLAAQIIGEVKIEKAVSQLVNLIEQQPANAPKTPDPRDGTYLQPRELRLACAAALAKMGYFGGWYVGDMYARDPEISARAQAAFVLGATASKQTLNPSLNRLEKMLDDENLMVRCSAAAALLKVLEKN
ncbi:MAG: HEAT repeat domain-containing protein [Phycisphaerales bacterium]